MTQMNPDQITETISITLLPQENGQYVCQISSSLSEGTRDCRSFYGQTKEHAMAIALEQLAADYRQIAEDFDTPLAKAEGILRS